MTKKEIVKQISEKLGLTQLKTEKIVQRTFDAIVDSLLAEGRIELRNFGVFEVERRMEERIRQLELADLPEMDFCDTDADAEDDLVGVGAAQPQMVGSALDPYARSENLYGSRVAGLP